LAEIRTLPNGVTLVAEPDPKHMSQAYGVFVRSGSSLEHPEQQGIAHVIEHMVFKGTENRTGQEIAWAIDDLGGDLDAFTSKEFTAYYSRVLPQSGPKALDLLADLALAPRFDEADLERERQVVVEEIRLAEDTPDELVHDLLEGEVFKGHALSGPVLGTEEAVRSFDADDLISFYRAHYRGENIVVSAAGAIDVDTFFRRAESLFHAVPKGARPNRVVKPAITRGLEVRDRPAGELHLTLGGLALPLSDPSVYAVQLLLAILGGGPSSRLFRRLREETGISYSVYAYDALYSVAGLFGIYMDLAPESLRQAVGILYDTLEEVRLETVTRKELRRAQEQVATGFVLGLETPYNLMEQNAVSLLLLGRIPGVKEVLRQVRAVTPADVADVARAILHPDRLSLAAVGPWPEEVPVEDWTSLS